MYQDHLQSTGNRTPVDPNAPLRSEMNLMIVWTVFALMTIVAIVAACRPLPRRQRHLRRLGQLTKEPGLAR
jgi:hypothetical protein